MICKQQQNSQESYKIPAKQPSGNSAGGVGGLDNTDQVGLFCEDIAVFGYVPYVYFMPEMNRREIDFI